MGLADEKRYQLAKVKQENIDKIINFTETFSVKPQQMNDWLASVSTTPLQHGCKLIELINRPQVTLENISKEIPDFNELLSTIQDRREETIEAAEIKIKYRGYIQRERIIADKMVRLENIKIRGKFNYSELLSLSTEARQKLEHIDPETIAQASRIPGVSPSDINVLLVLSQQTDSSPVSRETKEKNN
jgi:tRNA uridine 5-carboxymethylaminomethyl modification enzyme